MSNEEAIKELSVEYLGDSEKIKEAKRMAIKVLEQQPCEEDILKFYYVESLDDYWIGKRADTMYYAEWDDLQGFVLMYSRYLPWGKHVVEPNTLWKEYTYPSEPKEIPFGKWIKGFLKKHGREQQSCEDCTVIKKLSKKYYVEDAYGYTDEDIVNKVNEIIDAVNESSSITPQPKIGHWINLEETKYKGLVLPFWGRYECSKCGGHGEGTFNYCPKCGADMRESEVNADAVGN